MPTHQQPKLSKPPGCAGCSLERYGFGYAVPSGPLGARLTFIGESLGWEEALAGEAFIGAAGGVLSRILHRAGIERGHVRIANVVSCFPGDTRIEASEIQRGYRRWYEGVVVTVVTANGQLTGTPNHPVLTPKGWIALGELSNGQYLVNGVLSERMPSGDPDVHEAPPSFADLFGALTELSVCRRVVGAAVDFHGDGRESEIDVACADGELGHGVVAARLQPLSQLSLKPADSVSGSLSRESKRFRTSLAFRGRDFAPPRRVVGGRYEGRTPLRIQPLPPRQHRGATMSDRDTTSNEEPPKLRLSDALLHRERFQTFPLPIATSEILEVKQSWFSGHVFNLQTASQEYLANGFIVHNCRPPNDYLVGAPWETTAINHCRQYLQPVLDSVPRDGVVIPLGGTALDAVLNLRGVDGVAVKDFHGTVSRDPSDRFWVVPSFHPSFLQRGAMNHLEVVTQDVQLASTIASQGFTRSPIQLVVDPHPDWYRAWVAEHLRRVREDPDGTHLSLDTEFVEKTGADESEVVSWAAQSPITRVNGANDRVTGWTVPYREPYIGITETLLAGLSALGGWVWLWNKYADWDHLQAHGHTIDGIMAIDGMWLWHYIQSDLLRGLGFVAPMASDMGPWKHWGKIKEKEGIYAAADGVQNWRTCMWLLQAAQRLGMWDVFMRDWHERDQYVLRPAHVMGVPVDRVELEAFHQENQRKLGRILEGIKKTAAEGVLKPKDGYAKRPKGPKCSACGGKGATAADVCTDCFGTGECGNPTPPKSIIGAQKKGKKSGNEAKQQYMLEGVRLVERDTEVVIANCATCLATDVGPKHKCPLPPKPKKRRSKTEARDHMAAGETPVLPPVDAEGTAAPVRPVAQIVEARAVQRRWYWQLPFNPDAPQQILAYLASQKIDAPIDKKRGVATTNKKALEDLKKKHSDDPFFKFQLDWKAVQKVDATYAVGTLERLDQDDRVHPEYFPIPSTLRDSAKNPNLTNVVADKAGPQGLASGFRRCIVARDGVPPGVSEEDVKAWEEKWASLRG